MSDRDRSTILERRALFLGSALAALGACGPKAPATEPSQPQVLSIPATSEQAPSDPEPVDTPPARNPTAAGEMPPLDVPPGVSSRAQQNYESLAKRMTTAHRILDELKSAIPSCSISSCEAKWNALAEKHLSLDDAFRFSYICPGSSDEAKAYGVREKAHMDYYQTRRKEVEDTLRAKLDSVGNARYEQLKNDIRSAHPVPCLSIACLDW